MTSKADEQERAEFEVWADDRGFPLKRTIHGEGYQDLRTQGAFEAYQAGRSALQSQDREDAPASAMSAIADRYAHVMAMHLECILLNYSGPFSGEAMQTLGQYRDAMNAIHEAESPTHMGEPLIDPACRVEGEAK